MFEFDGGDGGKCHEVAADLRQLCRVFKARGVPRWLAIAYHCLGPGMLWQCGGPILLSFQVWPSLGYTCHFDRDISIACISIFPKCPFPPKKAMRKLPPSLLPTWNFTSLAVATGFPVWRPLLKVWKYSFSDHELLPCLLGGAASNNIVVQRHCGIFNVCLQLNRTIHIKWGCRVLSQTIGLLGSVLSTLADNNSPNVSGWDL